VKNKKISVLNSKRAMADSIDDLFECFEEAPQSANALKQEESEEIQPSSNR
jgi:hypothetical protein